MRTRTGFSGLWLWCLLNQLCPRPRSWLLNPASGCPKLISGSAHGSVPAVSGVLMSHIHTGDYGEDCGLVFHVQWRMLCCVRICIRSRLKSWLVLQIWSLISLSRVPSLEITLPSYLKSSTVFTSVPSIKIERRTRGGLQQNLSLAKTDGEAKKAWGLRKLVDIKLGVRFLVCHEGTIVSEEWFKDDPCDGLGLGLGVRPHQTRWHRARG